MNEKVKRQILAVRATGRTNMFDVNMVQRIAYDMDLFELTDFLTVHRSEYLQFILTGEEGSDNEK